MILETRNEGVRNERYLKRKKYGVQETINNNMVDDNGDDYDDNKDD